ncbi:hypothetical protein WBG78_15700 [Chryseolinea sp. T2]|uniref:tyrosine-type recombinase/integrase n=1 Tax=Chryseolinea sp. T2 TaxID=3129255 RepID=UPI003077078E
MKVSIDLYRGVLTLRFSVNRKTYKYSTGVKLTEQEWKDEKRKGFKKAMQASEIAEKASNVIDVIDKETFSFAEFKRLMEEPTTSKDPVVVWFERFIAFKVEQRKAVSTIDALKTIQKIVNTFVKLNQKYSGVLQWNEATLAKFNEYMIDSGIKNVTTRKVYLTNLRTFFNYLVKEVDVLTKSPFASTKFKIPKSKAHWFPYNDEELKTLLAIKPNTKGEWRAFNWFRLMLFTGGTDFKDFAIMKWNQVKAKELHIIRAKTDSYGDASQKLIPFSEDIRELFDALKGPKGDPDDYVFKILDPNLSAEDNHQRVHSATQTINNNMNRMLGGKDSKFRFVIKRIRPTAAVISNEVGGVAYSQKMLMHSNLSQTSVYLANIPSERLRKSHAQFENAIKNLSEPESVPDSK